MALHVSRIAAVACFLTITGRVLAGEMPVTILDLRDDTNIGAWQPIVAALGDSRSVDVLLDPSIRLPDEASLKLPLQLDTTAALEMLQRLGALVYLRTRAKRLACYVLLRDALTEEDKKEAAQAIDRCLAFGGDKTHLVMRLPDNPIATIQSLSVAEFRQNTEKLLQSPFFRYATLPKTIVLSVIPAGASEHRNLLIRAYENGTEEIAQQGKTSALLQATSQLFADLDRKNVMDDQLSCYQLALSDARVADIRFVASIRTAVSLLPTRNDTCTVTISTSVRDGAQIKYAVEADADRGRFTEASDDTTIYGLDVPKGRYIFQSWRNGMQTKQVGPIACTKSTKHVVIHDTN